MSARSWDLLYALSHLVPVPMRFTYRPAISGPQIGYGISPIVGYGPYETTWWVQWRGRILWERTRPA